MKTICQLLGLVLVLNCNLHAQTVTIGGQTWNLSVLPLVAPEDVPARGTFHRLTHLNYPALPFDSAPGSPVYWLGTNTAGYGIYLIDDSEFEDSSLGGMAAVSRMATMLDATQDSGGTDWPSVNYSSTDLWLEITNGSGPANFQITIHTPETNGVYDLFMATNLVTKNWVWLLRTEPGQTNVPLTNMPQTQAFFILGGMQDSDGDGLTDAYETLVSKTDPLAVENRIQTENAITGTADWMLTNPATPGWPTSDADTVPEIEGFASETSVNVGDSIQLYVDVRRAEDTNFTVEIFRMGWYGGLGGRKMTWTDNGQRTSITLPAVKQPVPAMNPTNGLVDCLCGLTTNGVLDTNLIWRSSYTLAIPTNWVSGVYLARLTTGTNVTPQTTGKQSYIIFVVREDARSSDLLFQSSATTFEAYNPWGGSSLYPYPYHLPCYGDAHPNTVDRQGGAVSFNRPYAAASCNNTLGELGYGTGAGEFLTMINQDATAAWEYNMLRWLERRGYDVTYSTSIDTHRPWPAGKVIRGLLSVGHDEYWSSSMRQNVEAARDRGVNLGFFGANTCFWRIHFDTNNPGDHVFTCDRNTASPTCDLWRGSHVGNPEVSMIGVEYVFNTLHADMKMPNPLPPGSGIGGLHWAYDYTGLTNGESLPGLLGYEVDGYREAGSCNYIQADPPNSNTVILADSLFACTCNECGTGPGHALMTLYTNANDALVFATGSMEWNWGLDSFGWQAYPGHVSRVHPAAQQMTHNVLRKFIGKAPSPVLSVNSDTAAGGNLVTKP